MQMKADPTPPTSAPGSHPGWSQRHRVSSRFRAAGPLARPRARPADPPLPLLLTVPKAASLLSVSVKTLWHWVGLRKIASVKLGGLRRIERREVERLIEAGREPAWPDGRPPSRRR